MKLIALLSLLLCAAASADPVPLSAQAPALEDRWYPTVLEAAKEALKQTLEASEPTRSKEWGGVIVWTPRGYRITAPRTDAVFDSVELPHGKLYGLTIVADYHMHVCASDHRPGHHTHVLTQDFSPWDVAENNAYHTDGYLLDTCWGNMYWYPYKENMDPADGPLRGYFIGWLKEITL